MTKSEWSQTEEALKGFYSLVNLKVDEYDVSLILEHVGIYKNAIMVYVGGKFQGKWLMEDCEERRRFFQKKVRSLLTAKQKAGLKKLSSKRQKEYAENFQYEIFSPQWTSFCALKKHLIANNKSIELVKIG